MSKFSRRFFLCGCGAVAFAASAAGPSLAETPSAHGPAHAKTSMTADQALALLKEGNAAFVRDASAPSIMNAPRRLELARGQTPFAVLVGCSDSRVPPELLFGRGLGELFIVRNAGNTVDNVAQGSIEYGVAELGAPLIVVLGHERCGAVAAAVEAVTENKQFPGSIGRVVEPIIPSVLKAQRMSGDLLDNAVRENVSRVVAHLRSEIEEPVLAMGLRDKTLKVVGARYDLDTGAVEFFNEG